MFKHITSHPWHAANVTVWGYPEEGGYPQVANCKSLSLPLATQRANARLMSLAPQMFEIIQTLHNNPEAQAIVRFMNKEEECE